MRGRKCCVYYYKLQSSFSYGMQRRLPLVSPTGRGGSQPVTPSALALCEGSVLASDL